MKFTQLPVTMHFTSRTENAGEEKVSAASLTLTAELKAEALNHILPSEKAVNEFREAFWDDDGNVRHGISGPLELDRELIGGKAKIETSLAKESLEFEGVDIKAVKITPREGHTFDLKCRMNFKPTEKQAGKLHILQDREILVSCERASASDDAKKAGQQSMALPVSREEEKPKEAQAEDKGAKKDKVPQGEPLVPGQRAPQRPKGANLQ